MYTCIYIPRESPIWKRDDSAHLLRESNSEDGISQALVLPPTKMSVASVKLINRDMNSMPQRIAEIGEEAIDMD